MPCTGNQGRKDDLEYVAALLRHGARVDDRRKVRDDNGLTPLDWLERSVSSLGRAKVHELLEQPRRR
jgi:hypothetical protein